MKTELMLMIMTDARPIMYLKEVADLIGIGERHAENQIHAETFPLPAFKAGKKWAVHLHDVAVYIDAQRADATKALEGRAG